MNHPTSHSLSRANHRLLAGLFVTALLCAAPTTFAQPAAGTKSKAMPAATEVKSVPKTDLVEKADKALKVKKPKKSEKAAATEPKATIKTKPNGEKVAKPPKAEKPSKPSKGLEAQFAKADVDKRGFISKKQAFKAGMYEVDRYFFDIDTSYDGYVSMAEIMAWKANPVRTAPRPRGDKLDRVVEGDVGRK